MPIDYLKIYNQIIHSLDADDLLVKVRPNNDTNCLFRFNVAKLLRFESKNVYPYAVTLSPKSSPLLKNKSLKAQYDILHNYLCQTLSLYCNKYFFTFEIYSDNINMHCHGLMEFRTAMDIKKFRKDAREFFNIKLKEREQDRLTHVKLLGNDEEARQRWIGYCLKEMKWSLINGHNPIFRWDDAYIKTIEHPKPNRKQIQLTPREPIVRIMVPSTHKVYVETVMELESEEEDEPEQQTTREYLEYLRLKSKFEKKTSSNFII